MNNLVKSMHNGQEILKGWFLTYEEISNNVYKVRLTDSYGRIVEATGTDLERLVEENKVSAMHINKRKEIKTATNAKPASNPTAEAEA